MIRLSEEMTLKVEACPLAGTFTASTLWTLNWGVTVSVFLRVKRGT